MGKELIVLLFLFVDVDVKDIAVELAGDQADAILLLHTSVFAKGHISQIIDT